MGDNGWRTTARNYKTTEQRHGTGVLCKQGFEASKGITMSYLCRLEERGGGGKKRMRNRSRRKEDGAEEDE